jgi:glycosyltransferase involved in cell wall biosynthesis
MRILTIIDSYPPYHSGGYELRCKDVVEGLSKKGHGIKIITTRCPDGFYEDMNEQMIERVFHKKSETPFIYQRIFYDFIDIKYIQSEVKKFKPDIIYLWHLGNLSNAIVPYFSNKIIPIVLDDGGIGAVSTVKRYNKGLYFYKNKEDVIAKKYIKHIINQAITVLSNNLIRTNWNWPQNMCIIFNSAYSMNYAKENDVPLKNNKVIYSGIDMSKFVFKTRKGVNSPIKIITPGRISPEKGTIDAVYFLSKVKEENIPVKLTLIGKKYSPAYYQETIREICKRNLQNKIQILPMVNHDNLAKLYQESDVCFFPSYQKYGLSRVPLEAMASGCLVITYGNEGSNEIIKNKENGMIIEEGNIAAGAAVLQEILESPPMYQSIIHAARQTIEENHSLDTYIKNVEVFLLDNIPGSKLRFD